MKLRSCSTVTGSPLIVSVAGSETEPEIEISEAPVARPSVGSVTVTIGGSKSRSTEKATGSVTAV